MISKNKVKLITSLQHKKYREKYNLFIVEGERSIITMIDSAQYEIEYLFYTSKVKINSFFVNKMDTSIIQEVSDKEMKMISILKSPSSMLAVFTLPKNNPLKKGKALYLDGVQNPGNVGTILRTADWFGIKNVIRSEDSADYFNPKTVQSSMGALAGLRLSILPRLELESHFSKIMVADMNGESLANTDLNEFDLLVVGSEGRGIDPEFKKNKYTKVSIDARQSKCSESLNVAVATGIICAKWM